MCRGPAISVCHDLGLIELSPDCPGTILNLAYRNNYINGQTSLGQLLLHRLGQHLAHGHTTPVHADTVDGGIWAGKVDVFENIWSENSGLRYLSAGHFFTGDDDCLA